MPSDQNASFLPLSCKTHVNVERDDSTPGRSLGLAARRIVRILRRKRHDPLPTQRRR